MKISNKFELKVGKLYKVKGENGWYREDSGMFEKGEVLLCEEIYPHIALMRRVRENIQDKKHAKECYPLQCIEMLIEPI